MKKIILTALILAAFATSAMAAATIATSTTIGSLTFAPSNSVTLSGDSTAIGYVWESKHGSGSRVFATDSSESKIYWRDGTTFTASAAAPTVAGGHGTPSLATMGTAL